MIIKKGADLNSAISAGAEIHLSSVFPEGGKMQMLRKSKGRISGRDKGRFSVSSRKTRRQRTVPMTLRYETNTSHTKNGVNHRKHKA
jgi:hypothetical protein